MNFIKFDLSPVKNDAVKKVNNKIKKKFCFSLFNNDNAIKEKPTKNPPAINSSKNNPLFLSFVPVLYPKMLKPTKL